METQLYEQLMTLSGAPVGPDNPLPPLASIQSVQQVQNLEALPADMAERIRYGQLDSVLPYRMQDRYSRDRQPMPVDTFCLENAYLKARVLPGLGGRLYSLYDKQAGRELLHANPAYQPANLALRGAWLAGGVEWNLGSTGHTTLTCEPMFAARLTAPDGTPLLRLWEWERTRNLVYQLDFWLPSDSARLLVGVRVRNPFDTTAPLYWWSNIAVPQHADTRVIVPATQTWHYGYGGCLDLEPVPGASDITYPAGHVHASDYFFELGDRETPWIAALDGRGYGLLQSSTRRLCGRKLFVWGTSTGGERWQRWLSPESEHGYCEIQAGLARTQLEHLQLPGHAAVSWMEAYGPVQADGAAVHGNAWDAAQAAVETCVDNLSTLEAQWQDVMDDEPGALCRQGSGWGALQRALLDDAPLPGTPFPDTSLGEAQQPWRQLLQRPSTLYTWHPSEPPGDSLVGPRWLALLEQSDSQDWLRRYHLGVARWHAGDRAGAAIAWQASIEAEPNAWALRCLAQSQSDDAVRAAQLTKALAYQPNCAPLAIEAITAWLEAGQAAEALALVDGLAASLQGLGRIRLLSARAALAAGCAERALAIFEAGFEMADVREGETALSDTWDAVQKALGMSRSLPERYDFRMKNS